MNTNQAHTVSPWFNALCILISMSIISILVAINLQYFDARETVPHVDIVQDVPVSSAEIKTGIFVRDISEFDVVKGKFTFTVVVWFSFDPTKISQDIVEQFTFEKAKEDARAQPFVRVDIEHERIIEYTLHLTSAMSLNYQHFPVDDHRLNLVLANYALSPQQAHFVTQPQWVVVSPEIQVEGWRLMDKNAIAGHFTNSINPDNTSQVFEHARVVFTLDFERSGIRHMVSIILPMLIIFFVTLFSFSINPVGSDYYNVVALSVASIMALIAYRFVIETISPNTAYFTLSDYIFMFFLIATLIVLFVNSLGESISARNKKIATVLLHVFIIVVFAYYLAPWW